MSSIALQLDSNDGLTVQSFSIVETMNALFQIQVVAQGPDNLDVGLPGTPASFSVVTTSASRLWTGVSASISLDRVLPNGLGNYSLVVAPQLYLLCHRTNSRLFQHLSIPEIAAQLLAEWNMQADVRLKEKHPKLELRVQYGETDYDFLRRILAEAGISFYFEPTAQGSKLVLADEPNTNPPRNVPLPFAQDPHAVTHDHVSAVAVHANVHATKATFADHDFRRPQYKLHGDHTTRAHNGVPLEHYQFKYGHSQALQHGHGGASPVADAHGAYRHQDQVAKAQAQRHLDALASAHQKVSLETNLMDLVPGTVFAIEGHPHPEIADGKRLLVTESWINGNATGHLHCGGHCCPADVHYRPYVAETLGTPATQIDPFKPLTAIVKPRIAGVQNALVVGASQQSVNTDEHGRVQVQFPWDRQAQDSPWIRVSQASAGAGHGHVELPRVGQEVLVSYLDGDPDQPMVVGRVFNATNPMPYPLPANKTRMTWKSGSPSGDGNEVTFDNAAGHELFYMQAQRDFHKVVSHDELEHTMGSRHISVDGDLIIEAKGKIVLHGAVVHAPTIEKSSGPKATVPPQLSTGKPKPSAAQGGGASNASLFKINPGNRPAADAKAANDLALAKKYQPLAIELGKKYHMPPALILGWMARESDFGTTLGSNGWSGNAFGVLQVDKASGAVPATAGGPFGEAHLGQAFGEYDGDLSTIQRDHPDWTTEQQQAAALVAYNAGPGNARTQPTDPQTWAQLDSGTANNDYSRDTWAMGQYYAKNLEW